MTHRRLILGLAFTLLITGCAHLGLQPADDAAGAATAADEPQALADSSEPAAPERETDLWDRIRAGLQMEERTDPRVEAEIAYYASRPEYIDRVADRAAPYLHYIVEQLEKRGMPMELALLPVIESAYQPFAYSPGRAAGIWQFIPSTGRHYGLKQTWWYDGRRDVIASTNAALDYLQQLYNRFSDWELALAAYNAGQGNVNRAIRNNERRGLPTDYWSLKLPRETQHYVPRLLAIRALVAEPERYGLTLRSIPDKPYLTVVEIGSQIDLALAAELAGMSVDELYRLNPGFNRWATDPDGPHLLVVPIEAVERFEMALTELPPEKRVRWERHKIASGDTLIGIAKRYHTTVEVLRQVNDLRGSRIRAGQHLIVPVASRSAEHYTLSASQRLAQTQQKPRAGEKHIHTVQRGDTLWDLARRYGTTTRQLAQWNGMSPRDTIRPGQNLVVWLNAGGSGIQKAVASPADAVKPPVTVQQVRYKVRRGDSLYLIARKFNVSVDDLLRWNNLSRKSYLQPGQSLVVHVDITGGSI